MPDLVSLPYFNYRYCNIRRKLQNPPYTHQHRLLAFTGKLVMCNRPSASACNEFTAVEQIQVPFGHLFAGDLLQRFRIILQLDFIPVPDHI